MNLHPGKHRTSANIDQRRRRWADAAQILYKCSAFAGIGQKLSYCRYIINLKIRVNHETRDIEPMRTQCRSTFCDAGLASKRHRPNASRLLDRDRPASGVFNAGARFFDFGPASNQQQPNVLHLPCVEVVQHRPNMVGHYHTNAEQTPYISCQIHIFSPPPQQTLN